MDQLQLFREDSRVSHSPQPGSEEAQRMTATYGRKCFESYMYLNRLGSWLRTFADCFLSTMGASSPRYYLTWKLNDTKWSRLYILLTLSEPRTGETEYSLLPTPVTVDTGSMFNKSLSEKATNRPTLGAMAKYNLWPTAKEQNARGNGQGHGDGGKSLDVEVGGQLNPAFVEWLMGFPIGWTDLEH
jgi:hypothetical protein